MIRGWSITRAVAVLLGAILAAAVGAKLLYNAAVHAGSEPAAPPWGQDRMEFIAWNEERWTAWINGERFVLAPRAPGKWRRHANATLAFLDWDGEPWQAKIDNGEFLLARRGDWKGRTERASALRYRDWHGRRQLRTVAQLTRRVERSAANEQG
jgi:hypothetical protein